MVNFFKKSVLILKAVCCVLWPCTTDMHELASLPHALCPWHRRSRSTKSLLCQGHGAALISFPEGQKTQPLEGDENAVKLFKRAAGLFCLSVETLCPPGPYSPSIFSVSYILEVKQR